MRLGVTIIGSGRVAGSLCEAISGSSYELREVCARNEARGRALADAFGCGYCADPAYAADADIYIISVKDDAIGEVASRLKPPKGAIVVHTAGSVAMSALPGSFCRGVFYPLQSFPEGRKINFREVPLFLEADTPEVMARLKAFASELSYSVAEAGSEERARLHLAAVFASNFTNHMYAIGEEILRESGIDPKVLGPLIMETAAKAAAAPAARIVQTGPAVRGDAKTMEAQRRRLSSRPELLSLYEIISKEIWETSKKI